MPFPQALGSISSVWGWGDVATVEAGSKSLPLSPLSRLGHCVDRETEAQAAQLQPHVVDLGKDTSAL